ncbi:hypothetical protein AB5N19_05397 [Seiridium cardinale]
MDSVTLPVSDAVGLFASARVPPPAPSHDETAHGVSPTRVLVASCRYGIWVLPPKAEDVAWFNVQNALLSNAIPAPRINAKCVLPAASEQARTKPALPAAKERLITSRRPERGLGTSSQLLSSHSTVRCHAMRQEKKRAFLFLILRCIGVQSGLYGAAVGVSRALDHGGEGGTLQNRRLHL